MPAGVEGFAALGKAETRGQSNYGINLSKLDIAPFGH